MTTFLVIGAAGHAQEVAWSLREEERAAGRDATLRFFDDALPLGPVPSGLGDVVGRLDDVAAHAIADDVQLVLGIGLPQSKAAVVRRLATIDRPWRTVVHPRATVGPNVTIGAGSYVAAGAILTVNVRLGRFVTANLHCQVAHDGTIGDFVTLHPDTHLAGNVVVDEGAELGTGSVVVPGRQIGPWAVLGAGAVAVHSLAGAQTYVGMPAAVRPGGPVRLHLVGRAPS